MKPSKREKYLAGRKRNAWYLKDPGYNAGAAVGERVTVEDIDLDAIDRTVAFSDWYEAVLESSPLAKNRR